MPKKPKKKTVKAKKKLNARRVVKKSTAKTKKSRTASAQERKRPAVKKKSQKLSKPVAGSVKKPKIKGTLVGTVTHYFPHVNAAAIKIEKREIRSGDQLYFKGHTTDFEQVVTSLQIDHKPVDLGALGDEVGVQVKARVRPGDHVYKL